MTDTTEITLKLLMRENEIEKHYYNSYLEIKESDEIAKTTYITNSPYLLLITSIKRKEKILAKFFRSILVDNKRYFIIREPAKKNDRIYFHNMINNLGIKFTRELTISYDSEISFRGRTDKNTPRAWADKLPLMEQYFKHYLQNPCEIYQLPEIPLFPLYMSDEKSADKFVYSYTLLYSERPYSFYAYAVCSHIILYCGLTLQTKVNTVVASIKDIRKLIPDNLSIDRFIKETKGISIPVRVEKIDNKTLKFTFGTEYIERYCKNRQYFKIPVLLLPKVFSKESFGKGGLAYFLMVMFAFHNKQNKMNYKPSTIIKLTHITDKRGKKYAIETINRPLLYMKDIRVIRSLKLCDEESYKEDKAIWFYLNVLDRWQPPKN